MATGNDVWGGALPYRGAFEAVNDAAATDHATFTQAASQTGDSLVLRLSDGTTEIFVVEDGGNVVIDLQAAGDIGLRIQSAASATGNFVTLENSAGTDVVTIAPSGAVVTTLLTAAAIPFKAVQAASATGNSVEIENSSNKDLFVVNSAGKISRMVCTTVALASMASDGTQTVTLTGATTGDDVHIAFRADPGGAIAAYVSAANVLKAEALGVATNAVTIGVWYYLTAAEA